MMDPSILALMIPIIAISGGIFAGVVKTMTRHRREMAEMRARHELALAEVQARRPVEPPFDVSAQYELQLLRDRVALMEARAPAPEPNASAIRNASAEIR